MLRKETLVSVIVAVFNSEKYLKKCLESVINQTHKNLEIIIINDGSTDNSLSIINDFAKIDSRIVTLNQNNKGVSYARNVGIKYSSGSFLCFVDSDDWIELNMIEVLLQKSIDTNSEITMCGHLLHIFKDNKEITKNVYQFDDPDGMVFNQKQLAERFIERLLYTGYNTPCGKLYTTQIIKENNICFPNNICFGEDLIFNLEVLKKINKLAWVKSLLYHYRIDNEGKSLTQRYTENLFYMDKEIYKAHLNMLHYWNIDNQENIIYIANLFFERIKHNVVAKALNSKKYFVCYKNIKEILHDNDTIQCINIVSKHLDKKNHLISFLFKHNLINAIILYVFLDNSIKNKIK